METQPRHAAAQVTLLEASFVFLPGLRRGENPSSEQHSFASSQCCCRLVHARRAAASTAGQAAASTAGQQQRSCVQQQWQQRQRSSSSAASAERRTDQGAEQVPSASRSSSSRRAPGSSSGERRAAAATESSLVQARKSGLTKANIDPQPPSTVVLQARAQLRKRSLQDVGNTNARVTGSHLLWLCSRPVSTAAE
jgi:hypothetical protein